MGESGSTHGASPHPHFVLMRRHPKPDLHRTGRPRHGVTDKQLLHPVLPDDPRADPHRLADRRHTGVGELLGSQGTRLPRDSAWHVRHKVMVSNKRTSHLRRCRSTTHHKIRQIPIPEIRPNHQSPVIARSCRVSSNGLTSRGPTVACTRQACSQPRAVARCVDLPDARSSPLLPLVSAGRMFGACPGAAGRPVMAASRRPGLGSTNRGRGGAQHRRGGLQPRVAAALLP